MVARASSGRRRGPRSEHDPLGLSVPTNGDHRERCRKQLQGVFRHKGGDFPAWRISTRKLLSHADERGRGPWRPGACREHELSFAALHRRDVDVGQHRRELRGLERRRAGEGGLDGLTRSRCFRSPRRPGACPACRACPWPWRPVPVKLERPLRPGLARGLAPCRTGIIDSSKWCLSCQTHSVAAGKVDVSMGAMVARASPWTSTGASMKRLPTLECLSRRTSNAWNEGQAMNVDVGHGGRGPVDVRTKVIAKP